MKPLNIMLAVVALISLVAIGMSEHYKAEVAVSSDPVFHMMGDTQRELTRLPVVFTQLPDDEEIRIGDQLAANYTPQWEERIKKDPASADAQKYVSEVGMKVAARAQRRLPYRFHYVPDDNFVNAFALPGGHVFIGQGLISLMDSEDELASVLGHEVEHLDLRHCAERVQLEARLKRLPMGSVASAVAEIPYEIFAAGYSKEQELDADLNGTQLAVGAGYSANGAIRLFEVFEQFEPGHAKAHNPSEELAGVAAESLQEYFRSHPRVEVRVRQIKNLIAERGWPATQERNLRIEYIALSQRAQAAFAAYDYPKTIALGNRSIAQQPRQVDTLKVLYSAEMFTGKFVDAAESAKRLIELEPREIGHVQDFADALAAQGKPSVSTAAFIAVVHPSQPARDETPAQAIQARMESAGLSLLAGENTQIDTLTADFTNVAQSQQKTQEQLSALKVQELLQRAGHWYYLAGKYEKAFATFTAAREVGLGHDDLTAMIGFSALQLGRMFIAQQEFDRAGSTDSRAGLAVMYWRTEDKDRAVRQIDTISTDPRWKNKDWVSFAYGARIADDLDAVRAERDRRREAERKKLLGR